MANTRVHEIALELSVTSREVITRLIELGEYVRGPSSAIAPSAVRKLMASYGVTPSALAESPAAPTTVETEISPSTTPPSTELGWRAGAVKAPIHADLLSNVERLEKAFPEFRRHRDALSQLGSQVVFAGFCKAVGFSQCGVALVRFSGAIEAGFGLTREVMIFYSPHRDLQVRTYQAAISEVRSMSREITPDLLFMSAPDPRMKLKLDDWSTPALRAIPLEHDMDDEAMAFVALIRDYVYSRDLFYETTPVRGASFFGRTTLLQSLRDDVLKQRVSGIFGLRKAGKTSVLLQLSDLMRDDKLVPVFLDLEAFPSPPEDPTSDILSELRRLFLLELKQRGLRTKELAETPLKPSILELKTALLELFRRLEPDGIKILLMLDEIEYLTPADKVDISEGDMPRISQFLASLRSLVQETSNFTFILSGLTSAIIENGRLYGRPNPLFSWAKSYYVGPLERGEADSLASSTGVKMGIEIESKALEALYDSSGGHAFLYRNFASNVVEALPVDVFRRIITKPLVLSRLLNWKANISGNITEMIAHLSRYYPTESVLLEVLRDLPDDFKELAEAEPLAVRHLVDLGLIRVVDYRYELNSLLDLL